MTEIAPESTRPAPEEERPPGPAPESIFGPDSRVEGFVTRTGKVHKSASYEWGVGIACSDRFTIGTATSVLVRDINCEHCIEHDLPDTWEVRIADKRYSDGYRVASKGLPSKAAAEALASQIGKKATVASTSVAEPTEEAQQPEEEPEEG